MKKTIMKKMLLMTLGLALSSGAPTQSQIDALDAAKPNPVRQLAKAKQALDVLNTQYSTEFVAAQVNGFGSQIAITEMWVNAALSAAKTATQFASTLNSDSAMSGLTGAQGVITTSTRRLLTSNLNQVYGALESLPVPVSAADPAPITPFVFPALPAIATAARLGSALTAVTPNLSAPGTTLSTLNISGTTPASADVSLAGAAVALAATMEAVAAVNMTDISITADIPAFYQNLNNFCGMLEKAAISLINKASSVSSANAPAASVNTATGLLSSIILTSTRLGAFQWNLNVTNGYVMGSDSSNFISNYLAFINWASNVSDSSTTLLGLANSLNGLSLNSGAIDASTEISTISGATPAFNTTEVTSIINAYANGLTAAVGAAHIAEAATASAIGVVTLPTAPHTALSLVTTATAASIVPTGDPAATALGIKAAVSTAVSAITNAIIGGGGIAGIISVFPTATVVNNNLTAATNTSTITNAIAAANSSYSVFSIAQLTSALGSISTAATTAATTVGTSCIDVINAATAAAATIATAANSVSNAATGATPAAVQTAVNGVINAPGFDAGIKSFIDTASTGVLAVAMAATGATAASVATAVMNAVNAINIASIYIATHIVSDFSTDHSLSTLQTAFNANINAITDSSVKLALTPITTAATKAAVAIGANGFTFASAVLNEGTAVTTSAVAIQTAAQAVAATGTIADVISAVNAKAAADSTVASYISATISAATTAANLAAGAATGASSATIKNAANAAVTAVLPSSIFTGNLNYALSYVNGYTTVGIFDLIYSTLALHPNSLNLISQFCFSWLTVSSAVTNSETATPVLLKILGFYLSGATTTDIQQFSTAVQGLQSSQSQQLAITNTDLTQQILVNSIQTLWTTQQSSRISVAACSATRYLLLQQILTLQGSNTLKSVSQFCNILQSCITTNSALITPVLQRISNLNFTQNPEALSQIAQYSGALSTFYNATDSNNAQLATLRGQISAQYMQIAQLKTQINGPTH